MLDQQDWDNLEEESSGYSSMGRHYQSLQTREKILVSKQRTFGDPSAATDAQKLALASTVHAIAVQQVLAAGSRTVQQALEQQQKHHRASGCITADLSPIALIGFGMRLLSPGSLTVEGCKDNRCLIIRAQLHLDQGQLLHQASRTRAAIPVVRKGIVLMKAAKALSEEVVTALLSLCALHSASSHHKHALLAAHRAMRTVLEMEDQRWSADPSAQNGARGAQAPRSRIYYGSLQAMCYHNIAVEQEHLGLLELALDSYQTGYELAYITHGANNTITTRLKRCYSELFTTLHKHHFASKVSVTVATSMSAFPAGDKAVAQLNSTYVNSQRHQQAVKKENRSQEKALKDAEVDEERAERYELPKDDFSPTYPPHFERPVSQQSSATKLRSTVASASLRKMKFWRSPAMLDTTFSRPQSAPGIPHFQHSAPTTHPRYVPEEDRMRPSVLAAERVYGPAAHVS